MPKQKIVEQGTMKLEDVVTMIPVEDLRPNPYQPETRRVITEEEAKKGWLSLERSSLIHFPVVRRMKKEGEVCSVYEVGDGWQRKLWFEYGCQTEHNDKYARVPCIVKELTDQQMADLIAEANGQRRDMNPIEWAEFFHRYLEKFGGTQKKLAEHYNLSQGEIANTMRLLELPEDIKTGIISHEITESHGRELLRLNNKPEKQKVLIADIKNNRLPVADLTRRVDEVIRSESKSLDPKANSWQNPPHFDVKGCKDCAHAEKLGRELRCLDAECWNKKQKAAGAEKDKALLEKLKEQGIEKLYNSNELKSNQYANFYGDIPNGCKQCAYRGAIKHSYNDGYDTVCLDPKCWQEKREEENKKYKAKQTAENAKQKKEKDEKERRITDAVENCEDENAIMQAIIFSLVDDMTMDDELLEVFGVQENGCTDDSDDEDATMKALLAAMDKLNPHALMKKLLAAVFKSMNGRVNEEILARLEKPGAKHAPREGDNLDETGDLKEEPENYGQGKDWKCRVCGCDDEHACQTPEGPCHWVEPNLCSACVGKEGSGEPVKGLPCNDCKFNDACDRSYFHTDEEGGYQCGVKDKPAEEETEKHHAVTGTNCISFAVSAAKFKEVEDSYSADVICYGKSVRKPFIYMEVTYLSIGGGECYQLVERSKFEGKALPYAEHNKANDPDAGNPEGNYHGMLVKKGKEEYVLVGPPVVFYLIKEKGIATIIDPGPGEYKLNHTYRFMLKDRIARGNDITAQDLPTALSALKLKPEEVESVRVWKSSGKPGTGGQKTTAGWGKCTEELPAPEEEKPALNLLCVDCAKDGCDHSYLDRTASGEYVCDYKDAPPDKEPAAAPQDKDPFAGLKVTVAQKEGEAHEFQLRKVHIVSATLKEGAIDFLRRYKGFENLDSVEILEVLKKMPATPNVTLLMGMLEGKEKEAGNDK